MSFHTIHVSTAKFGLGPFFWYCGIILYNMQMVFYTYIPIPLQKRKDHSRITLQTYTIIIFWQK